MAQVTRVLSELDARDPAAAEQLLPLVYEELRTLAAAHLAREKPGQTLQATALVHEAYLRLTAGEHPRHWASKTDFFAAAAEAMRRILVDSARKKQTLKRGAGLERVDVEPVSEPAWACPLDLLALDDALERLAREEPLHAELVKLRFFAGLTMPQAAGVLGISLATAERYWTFARTFLFVEMEGDQPPESKKTAKA
jgi:RNA polymerase sigma factor (TIGR02999 family)